MAIPKVEYTQVPNVLLDKWMKTMSDVELRVTLCAVRKIIGYHKESQGDTISLTQFQDMTGLSRQGVINGIDAAIKRGNLQKIMSDNRSATLFKLVFEANSPDETESNNEVVNTVDQSTELTRTGQQNRPEVVNTVDTQKKVVKEKKEKEIATNVAQASTDDNSQLNENKKPRAPKQLVNDALVDELGKAFGVEAKGKDFGLYLKIAKELIEAGINQDEFDAYVRFVRLSAIEGKWKLSIPSLTSNGRPSEYVAKRKTKPSALNGNGASKAIEGRYVDKSSVTPVTDEYRKQYGLLDVTESEVPSFLLDETKG